MTNVNAQEVRGVETKLVKYHGSEYNYTWGIWYEPNAISDLWFGYSFRNMNSIPVSVDIELYADVNQKVDYSSSYKYVEKLLTTKTIVLEPGEEYIFKRESDDAMKVFDNSDVPRDAPLIASGGYDNENKRKNYRVTYKAYKLQ